MFFCKRHYFQDISLTFIQAQINSGSSQFVYKLIAIAENLSDPIAMLHSVSSSPEAESETTVQKKTKTDWRSPPFLAPNFKQ